MEKQWAEAWKRACDAFMKISDDTEFCCQFKELMTLHGDPNVPPPQGTILANQDTDPSGCEAEVAKAARRGFNS